MTHDVPVLEWRGAVRRFRKASGGETVALAGLDVAVPKGSVFGLLGRNGSGKTTALRVALGLLRPDAGTATVLGEDSRALSAGVRRRLGYLTEEPFEYDDLPIPHLLRFLSAFFPQWDAAYAESLRARMQIPTDATLAEMSLGTRRRAELFLALAPRPELLILDDPWLGVDAVARRDFLAAALDAARDDGVTILFTSHVLTDVERIADRVAIVHEGRALWSGGLDDLKARCKRLAVELPPGVEASKIVVTGELRRTVADGVLVATTGAFDPDALGTLRALGAEVAVEDLNLEAAFVEMTRDADGAPGAAPAVAAPTGGASS